MNVTLPNGKVITGVPDGTPKDVVMQKAISSGLAQKSDFEPSSSADSFGDNAVGVLENAASIASGIVAEPMAGLAGIAQAINPFAEDGAGADAVKATRDALTYQPKTETGKTQQQAIGETLAPIGEALSSAESSLGDSTLDITGSPFLASIAHSLPTVALEALGFKGTKALKAKPKAPTARQIQDAVVESAPEVNQIKDASRAIYNEIDQSGVTVNPKSINSLVNRIAAKTRKEGLDSRVSPKAAGAMESLQEMKGAPQKIGELDVQRKIAQQVAKSPDATEAMYGGMIIDEIDSFMDSLSSSDVSRGNAGTAKKYKSARQLWGRAKRSELITDAIEKSKDTASGAENGLRIELRKIVNNKKKSKFFTKEELDSMRGVIQGDKLTAAAKFIGTMGFGSGGGANNLIPLIAASGAAALNPVALAGPAVAGSIARRIAHSRSLNKTKLVDKVILAGKDGREVAKAYLTIVPKARRSAADLADLLSDPDIDLNTLKGMANETLKEAVTISRGQRALAAAALASGAQQEPN